MSAVQNCRCQEIVEAGWQKLTKLSQLIYLWCFHCCIVAIVSFGYRVNDIVQGGKQKFQTFSTNLTYVFSDTFLLLLDIE